MDCNQALALISQRLDDHLTLEQEQALARHLAGCPACQRVAGFMVDLDGVLTEAPTIAAPKGLSDAVMVRVSRRARRERMMSRVIISVLALGLVSAALILPGTRAANAASDGRLLIEALLGALFQFLDVLRTMMRPLLTIMRVVWSGENQRLVILWVASAGLLVTAWLRIVSRAIRPARQEIPSTTTYVSQARSVVQMGRS